MVARCRGGGFEVNCEETKELLSSWMKITLESEDFKQINAEIRGAISKHILKKLAGCEASISWI